MKEFLDTHKQQFYGFCDQMGVKYKLTYDLLSEMVANEDRIAFMKTAILSNKRELAQTNSRIMYGVLVERLKSSNFVGTSTDILYLESLLQFGINKIADLDTVRTMLEQAIESSDTKNYRQLGKIMTAEFEKYAPVPKVRIYKQAVADSEIWANCLQELRIE